MQRILTSELSSYVGKKVFLNGWLNNQRTMGKLSFLIIRDRKGLSQVVIEDKEEIKKMALLQPGSILHIEGEVQSTSQAEFGVEIIHPKIHVEVPIYVAPEIEYYRPKIPSDLEHILDNRAISLRNREIQAVFKMQAEMTHAFRLYMHDVVGAVEYFGPNVIGASSEGGAEFFNVDYFGHSATLAQSSQLYKQMMVGVNERVFALMPFFRAEPSHTTRHLSEGKQFEFEMGFFDKWTDILDLMESCIKFVIEYLETHCKKEIEILGNNFIKAPKEVPFPRITFKEAQEIFYKRTGIDERQEPDLSPASERELCAWSKESFGTDLVFVVDWKIIKRPFYAYPNEHNKELSNTFDLLCAGTEISSGGQRRHTYDSMVEGILSKGMDPINFTDYLSIFKYGMPPHGGFGIGLERLTMTFLQLKNIREASLFPSDTKRIAGVRLKAKMFFGGENIRNEIIRLLKENSIAFKHVSHEETPTSEDSAKARHTKPEEGIKSIILKGKNSKKNYQFNLPSHLKLDMKAVSEIVGEKCEFEDPLIIKERFGLIIGGVPPFGNLINIDTYFDRSIEKEKIAAFNCGLLTESIVMDSKDLIQAVQPKFAEFAKI